MESLYEILKPEALEAMEKEREKYPNTVAGITHDLQSKYVTGDLCYSTFVFFKGLLNIESMYDIFNER
jgi:hypothetical protein